MQSSQLFRPRLLDRLISSAATLLTVVRAPAGYGKTVLLEQLAEYLGENAVLTRVASVDSDPVALIRRIHDIVGAFESERHLAAARWILVDDFDQLASWPQAAEAFGDLLFELPPSFHVIIATRTRPMLPLGRLRGMRAVREFGSDDLAFTATELRDVVLGSWALTMPADGLAALSALSEGWITGAALLLDGASASGSTEVTETSCDEYFDEVTARHLPRAVLDFASVCSMLEEISCGIAADVTDDPDAAAHLQYLAECGVFTSAGPRYKFHPLFRRYLHRRLERGATPFDAREANRRAARALANRGEHSAALVTHLVAGDVTAAELLLESRGIAHLRVEHFARIENLLESLSGPDIQDRPWLLTLWGRLRRLRDDFDGALPLVRAAEEGFSRRASREGLAWVATELNQLKYRDDAYGGSVTRVREELTSSDLRPNTRANLLAHLCWLLCETGPVSEAIAAGESALSAASLVDEPTTRQNLTTRAYRNLALASLYSGDLDRAIALVGEVTDGPQSTFEDAWRSVIIAATQTARGDIDAAERILRPIVGRHLPYGRTQHRWAVWSMGNVHRAAGRAPAARSAYAEAGNLATVDETITGAERLGAERLEAVARLVHARGMHSQSPLLGCGAELVRSLSMWAVAPSDAERTLALAIDRLDRSGHRLHTISLRAYRARLLADQGKQDAAAAAFASVEGFLLHNRIAVLPWGVMRGEDGIIRFADRDDPQSAEFVHEVTDCSDPAIRTRLERAHNEESLSVATVRRLRDEGLTWREIDVFVLYYLRAGTALGDGSSVRDRTARALGISEHTLKSHVTRLRAKIGEPQTLAAELNDAGYTG